MLVTEAAKPSDKPKPPFSDLPNDARELVERSHKMAGQAGNWIMAANAGGLIFIITAAREAKIPDGVQLDGAYAVFLMGLVMGFLGHFLTIAGLSTFGSYLHDVHKASERFDARARETADLAAAEKPRPGEWSALDARDREIITRTVWSLGSPYVLVVAAVLSLLSAAAAVYGLSLPLTMGMFQ